MQEIKLSDDLTTIETEIKSYQNIAGQSIFEIGRRLKHVKENDLAHGEFGKWLENVKIDRTQAHRFIKVSEEIKDVGTYQHLGLRALSEIASLPESERTVEHTTSKGETKTPDEMTVKELSELKKQLKQQEQEKSDMKSQLEQARKSEEMAINQLEAEQDKDPEVIERYMEPDDYETIKRKSVDLEQQNKELQDKIDLLKKEPKQEEPKSVPSQKNGEPIDYREQINADSQALEPEVRKAMRREQLAGEVIATCEDLIDLYDDIDDAEAFDKYISTLNYKALGKAKSKIEKLMKVGGYK